MFWKLKGNMNAWTWVKEKTGVGEENNQYEGKEMKMKRKGPRNRW